MIDFEPVQKQVFDDAGAREYLGIKAKSGVKSLVAAKRLTPLRITKENLFARSELNLFIERELEREKRLRISDNGEAP